MEKTFIYSPQNVCSREFRITYDGNRIMGLEVIGGCQGNLRGIGSLIVGMDIDTIITKLQGIKCRGSRGGETSCPDQISKALLALKADIEAGK